MAKRVSRKPGWLKTGQVEDIYSVSFCISDSFEDYIPYWKHNGYWFFDSPEIINDIAEEKGIDLTGTEMFYYEVYELQFNEESEKWEGFFAEKSLATMVIEPKFKRFEGYDIVTFSSGTGPECSNLSCNGMAQELKVNRHCLLESFEDAKSLLGNGDFSKCEPGPSRIFAVYTL